MIEQLAEKLQTDTATAADVIVWNANVVRGAVVDFDAERLHRWHLLNCSVYIVFRHAWKLGFDGIVSKRLGSRYRSGRSRDWIKAQEPGGAGR